jgi:flagellar biosynthetic protein FlhB
MEEAGAKSEQPTPFKLMRSREKGMIARGTDLGFLTGLAAFTGFCWIGGHGLAAAVVQSGKSALVGAAPASGGAGEILAIVGWVLSAPLGGVAAMAGTLFVAVLLLELVQTGFVFSTAPLKPDFSRLNPATGLKRLFSVRLLIETGKSVLKLGAYSAAAWSTVSLALNGRSATISNAERLAGAMGALGLRLLAGFACVALLFAVADQFIARRDFLKKMRMSRREVRRELRDREGEPRIKQRRKQLHGEFAKASQALRDVKGSDVVVTNPTRLAVALRYDPRTMAAPVVSAKGANELAARIRRLAFTHSIVIVEDKPLARALFRGGEPGREIPEGHYRAVASLYRKLKRPQARGAAA